jgi:hypothetical protein
MSTSTCSSCRMVWTVPETRYPRNTQYSTAKVTCIEEKYILVSSEFVSTAPRPPQLSKPICPPSLFLYVHCFCSIYREDDSNKSRDHISKYYLYRYICCEYSTVSLFVVQFFCIFWFFSAGSKNIGDKLFTIMNGMVFFKRYYVRNSVWLQYSYRICPLKSSLTLMVLSNVIAFENVGHLKNNCKYLPAV